jgi:hypothetical protein
MDWTTPVSTLIGAAVGVGSTLLAETVRARRDRTQQLNHLRRELYARYLAALTGTDGELQLLAVRHGTPVPEADLRTAWHAHAVLALNHEVQLIAPDHVADAADRAYRALRARRNLLATPADPASPISPVPPAPPAAPDSADTSVPTGTPVPADTPDSADTAAWHTAHRPYAEALSALRKAMRNNVGAG